MHQPAEEVPIRWVNSARWLLFFLAWFVPLAGAVALVGAYRLASQGQVQVGIVIGVFLGMGCTVWAMRRSRQGRARELAALCAARGFTYDDGPPDPRALAEAPFTLFGPDAARGGRARNWITATVEGRRVVVTDYEGRHDTRRIMPTLGRLTDAAALVGAAHPTSDTRVQQTVALLPGHMAGLSAFALRPLSVWGKSLTRLLRELFARRAGGPVLDALSRRYALLAPDGRPLPLTCVPEPLAAWLARNPGWVILGERGRLLVFREKGLCRVESVPAFLQTVWMVRRLLAGSEQ